ncbi:hypothetical protein ACIRRA_44595 [Nocardia sp. NPDC101769]|uniref:hypothetical protein n=1 Tax=Nocardia sp. NPDC101769 TaxID=3364333 RepID=UPI00380EBCCB
MNVNSVNPFDIHLIHAAPALVAALPAIAGEPIPGRSLVLLAVGEIDGGWSVVRGIQRYRTEQFDAHDGCRLLEDAHGERVHVLGVLVDRDTTRHTTAHAALLDDAGYYLDLQDAGLVTVYATTATTAGSPVWSAHTGTYQGPVPAACHRHSESAVYLLPAELTGFTGYPDHYAA